MRHAAVPGENFARLETFARGEMFQHAAAAAGKVLEIPPGGRDGQTEEPPGATVGLHDAAVRVHSDNAPRVGFDKGAQILVGGGQVPHALPLAQLGGYGFRGLAHQAQGVHMHHGRLAAE